MAGDGEAEAIRDVLLREREAKDLGHWEAMERCFAPDSMVRVSWFQGGGPEFVASARARATAGGTASFHEIGAIAVERRGDRALADASCTVHLRGRLGAGEPVEFDIASRARLAWQVRRADGHWLIDRLDAIYLRETIGPVDPSAVVSAGLLAPAEAFRTSYRYLALLLAGKGHHIDQELPGLDRPDLVDAMLDAQRRWLDQAR